LDYSTEKNQFKSYFVIKNAINTGVNTIPKSRKSEVYENTRLIIYKKLTSNKNIFSSAIFRPFYLWYIKKELIKVLSYL